MGYCSRCGQQLLEGMAFCGKCGTAVAQMGAQPPGAQISEPAPPPAQYSAAEEQGTADRLQQPIQMQPAYQLQPPQFLQPPHVAPYPPQAPYAAQQPYPPQEFYPPQPQPGQPPQSAWNIPFTTRDAGVWLRDAAILLGVALGTGFVLAALIGQFLPGTNHGNPADWFSVGFLLSGMALGAQVSTSGSASAFGLSEQFSGRLGILLITIAVLYTVRLLARRSVRGKPGAALKDLTIRSLGVSVAFVAMMGILALVVHIHSAYGSTALGSDVQSGQVPGGAVNIPAASEALVLSAGSLFLWPLVLTLLVWWGTVFVSWFRAGSTSYPNPTAAKLAWLWTCRPALLAVRAQVLIAVVLAGIGTYLYAVVEILQGSAQNGLTGGDSTRIVLGLLLGLPNLAVLAGSVSLGVPLTGLGPILGLGFLGGGLPADTSGDALNSTNTNTVSFNVPTPSNSIGFFGDQHPAVLYLLIAASVIATVVAAKWAVGKNWDRSRALLGPAQAWRGAAIGALLWTAVGFAGQLSVGSFTNGFGVDVVVGPSLAGLLLAGAIWGLLTCLAMSYFAGHLKPAPAPVPVGPFGPGAQPGPGGPVPAQSAEAEIHRESPDDVILEQVITLAPPDED